MQMDHTYIKPSFGWWAFHIVSVGGVASPFSYRRTFGLLVVQSCYN